MNKFKSFFNKLSLKDQEMLAKRLSFLIKSGAPILQSLQIIKDQTVGTAKQGVMERIVQDVANGQYLHTALSHFKDIFGSFTINIIKVGETSGILDQNLSYLS